MPAGAALGEDKMIVEPLGVVELLGTVVSENGCLKLRANSCSQEQNIRNGMEARDNRLRLGASKIETDPACLELEEVPQYYK